MSAELFQAIARYDLEGTADLLAKGASPNAVQQEWPGFTALQAAIDALEDGGSIESVALLLRHGAAVDGRDPRGEATPLLMALFRNQKEAARMLLGAGADANARSAEGDSPLRWSVAQNDLEMARLLLRCGAGQTINELGGYAEGLGITALGLAARALNVPMLQVLLDAGADPVAALEDDRPATECLPPRDASNAEAWDRATALLRRVGLRSSTGD